MTLFFKKTRHLKVRLRPSIVFLFILLVVPIFITMIWFTYASNEKMIRETATKHISNLQIITNLKIKELFGPVELLVISTSQLASADPAFFGSPKSWNYLLSHLNSSPNILSVDIGFEDGSFRSVRRVKADDKLQGKPVPPTAKYALRWIDKRSKEPNVYKYVYFDDKNQEVGSSSSDEAYIPKTRDWYKEAAKAGKLIISEPYIKKSGASGLSIASPFFVDKNIAGVVAIDLSLDSIGKFLNEQLISKNGFNLLLDEHGLIVASSNQKDAAKEIGGVLSMNQIYSMTSKVPSIAMTLKPDNVLAPFIFKDPTSQEEFVGIITSLPKEFVKKWLILIVTPLNDFAGPLRENNNLILLLGILAVLFQIGVIYFLANYISRPLELLTGEIEALINFKTHEKFKIRENITEINTLANAITKLKSTISAFTSYVPRDLVNDLLSSGKDIELGGESRYLTVLFSDLKDFSTLSEITPSRELLLRVSSYLELMTYAIKEEGGTIDKFIGDSVMAFWGAPLLNQNHAYHACVAAFKTKRRMVFLNEKLVAEENPPLVVRIGIHSDAVLVGNIGSAERLSYTVMGDGVNIAARLEGINKEFNTDICISHSLFKEAGERLWVRPIDQITVKGRKGELIIYELMGVKDGDAETAPTEIEKELCIFTKKAFDLYMNGLYVEALVIYEDLVLRFNDGLAAVMVAKCRNKINPNLS